MNFFKVPAPRTELSSVDNSIRKTEGASVDQINAFSHLTHYAQQSHWAGSKQAGMPEKIFFGILPNISQLSVKKHSSEKQATIMVTYSRYIEIYVHIRPVAGRI